MKRNFLQATLAEIRYSAHEMSRVVKAARHLPPNISNAATYMAFDDFSRKIRWHVKNIFTANALGRFAQTEPGQQPSWQYVLTGIRPRFETAVDHETGKSYDIITLRRSEYSKHTKNTESSAQLFI